MLKELSSKKIMLRVLDLADPVIESVETVADRIRNGLKYVSADRLVAAPDCGTKYMPRAVAFGSQVMRSLLRWVSRSGERPRVFPPDQKFVAIAARC